MPKNVQEHGVREPIGSAPRPVTEAMVNQDTAERVFPLPCLPEAVTVQKHCCNGIPRHSEGCKGDPEKSAPPSSTASPGELTEVAQRRHLLASGQLMEKPQTPNTERYGSHFMLADYGHATNSFFMI